MDNFIGTLAPYAIRHGRAMNILPSLILAQGILETGGGTSELAREANNLFGIKKGTGWDGPVHAVVTSEYRKNDAGEDEIYYITAEFRKYDSYEGAVIDLCDKYVNGTTWESHNRYEAVIGNFDFDAVTQAVKDAGYATDPNYPAKLRNIYEVYDLGQYDVGFVTDIIEEATEIIESIEEETRMVKVVFDAGHAKTTPGKRTPAGEREWTFNNVVVLAAIAELQRYANVEILRVDDPSGNTDVPLNTRTARANSWQGALYVSVHHNANTGRWGTWTGVETFVYTTSTNNSGSMKLAREVHPRLVKAMGLKDRGIKKANFAVIRQTKMPAILTEGGYMDSTIDIKKMRNNAVLRNAGVAIAQGIVAYAGLKLKAGATAPPVQAVNPKTLFRVRKSWADDGSQKGAFSDIDGAIAIAKDNAGYKVYDSSGTQVYPAAVATPKPTEDKLFRVRRDWNDADSQLGAFSDLEGAKLIADKNLTHNVYDGSGKLVYDPSAAVEAAKAKEKEAERLARMEEMRKAKDKFDAELAEAVQLGITDGTNPEGPATRAQVAVMIVRAIKYVLAKGN